jgi:UDP-N-acetylmuramoyl-tripeptide--D-alanyl-D-alanine ligase
VTQVRLTPAWVARAIGGTLFGGEAEREIHEVVIDSRMVAPGDLFVAIKGPRFDGHDFVADVLERGAVAAIVEKAPLQAAPYGGLIEVGDTVKALQDLAHAVRMAAGTRVIAITGSAGKTTTKDTIAAFLERRGTVVKNKGNLNNHIGLPLSLLQVRTSPDVAVMELGMNHRGEISTLVAIADPDVRVWTNVGDAHLGFFASADAIADAKAEILEGATASTVLVCNADDPRVMSRVREFPGRPITFGVSSAATVRALTVDDRGVSGTRAHVSTPAGEVVLDSPLLGRGNLSNLLAATAVAVDAGIPLDDIRDATTELRPSARRGEVRRLANGVTVVDDSYNSSPSALARALDVVRDEPHAMRKIAVLGEMLELGDHSARLHSESGRLAAMSAINLLYAIGGSAAQALAAAAVDAGMSADAVIYVASSEEAAPLVAAAVRRGDLVLVKGSRGIRTDVIVDRLVAERA